MTQGAHLCSNLQGPGRQCHSQATRIDPHQLPHLALVLGSASLLAICQPKGVTCSQAYSSSAIREPQGHATLLQLALRTTTTMGDSCCAHALCSGSLLLLMLSTLQPAHQPTWGKVKTQVRLHHPQMPLSSSNATGVTSLGCICNLCPLQHIIHIQHSPPQARDTTATIQRHHPHRRPCI
jgi:hypothetical protein